MLPLTRQIFAVTCCMTVVLIASTVHAQKLDNKRPTVFITFKDFIDKTKGAHPSQGARLLLHNNSRWRIHYETHYDPAAGGQQIAYFIELTDGKRDERMYSDVILGGKLLPGKTLTLVVPRDNFPTGSQIYVDFTFSWERQGGDALRNETVHRAYFLSSDLPAWPK
jgi:hypothetical protein